MTRFFSTTIKIFISFPSIQYAKYLLIQFISWQDVQNIIIRNVNAELLYYLSKRFSIRMGKCSERELNKINFLLKKISMFIIIAFVQWQRPYGEWPLTEITMTLLRKVWLSFSAEIMIESHFITTMCLFYPANIINPFLNNLDVVWVAPLAFLDSFLTHPWS